MEEFSIVSDLVLIFRVQAYIGLTLNKNFAFALDTTRPEKNCRHQMLRTKPYRARRSNHSKFSVIFYYYYYYAYVWFRYILKKTSPRKTVSSLPYIPRTDNRP